MKFKLSSRVSPLKDSPSWFQPLQPLKFTLFSSPTSLMIPASRTWQLKMLSMTSTSVPNHTKMKHLSLIPLTSCSVVSVASSSATLEPPLVFLFPWTKKDQSHTQHPNSTISAGESSLSTEENADNVSDIISTMKDNALPAALPHLTTTEKNVSPVKLEKSGMDHSVFLNQLTQLHQLTQSIQSDPLFPAPEEPTGISNN